MTIARIDGAHTHRISNDGDVLASGGAPGPRAPALLPEPFATSAFDDAFTSLAVITMRLRSEQRDASDQARKDASMELDDANSRKVAEMHELAEDTFAQGLVEGILEGASAALAGAGAVVQYQGDLKDIQGLRAEGKELGRNAALLSAGGKGLSAGGRLGGAMLHRDQELDREAMAVLDAQIDRAKSAEGAASADKQRATEDLRDLLNAIRQYIEAKTQLGNAGVFKG